MPIYEYRCPRCGTEFELMRAMTRMVDLAPCPKCGGGSEKLVSAFGSQIGYFVRAPAEPVFRKTAEGDKSGAG